MWVKEIIPLVNYNLKKHRRFIVMTDKRILPPTALVITIVMMTLLYFIFPIKKMLVFPVNAAGIGLLLVGALISVRGSNKFAQEKTTVMTFDTPTVLVIDGMYQYSRNPMYLGFVLVVFGIWMLVSCLSTLFVAISFFILMDRYYIPFEEKVLQKKFGTSYMAYKKRVRRWI
jgi:protein-S-isoprenylcysteine O-methyltransferase Ste14